MVNPRTRFFLILFLQLLILILDYPDRPNVTLPNTASVPPPQQTQFKEAIKPCPCNSYISLSDFKEAIQKSTDIDILKRLCADLSAKFNCDNVVQNSEVEQLPPT